MVDDLDPFVHQIALQAVDALAKIVAAACALSGRDEIANQVLSFAGAYLIACEERAAEENGKDLDEIHARTSIILDEARDNVKEAMNVPSPNMPSATTLA